MVRSKLLVSFLLIATVAIGFGNVAWITLKAELAQLLIEQAWAKTLQTGAQVKPWQWADTWPVGRMVHPNSNTDLLILEGAQGNALAFGPGRHVNTGELGSESSVIGGHKDTHFAFLAEANVGDALQLQTKDGVWHPYRISAKRIVDIQNQALNIQLNQPRLYLVTCYPFYTITRDNRLRLVVELKPS
ncbi:hypothetical protein KUL118_05270 [Tenacibaculum sp. KUL118]|nr:hypothetical protein KUL118_05270 [Tenacibaculum sp. KUL118]